MQWKKKVYNFLKITVGLTLTIWLIFKIDYHELAISIKDGEWIWLIIGVALFFFVLLVLQPIKLHLLLKGLVPSTFTKAFRGTMIGNFFNNLLPSSIGGDVVKAYYFKKQLSANWHQLFSIILFERISGLLVLLIAGIGYVIFFPDRLMGKINFNTPNNFEHFGLIVLIAFFVVAGTLFFFRKKIKYIIVKVIQFLRDSYNSFISIGAWLLIWGIIISALFHLLRIAGFYLILLFFNQSIQWENLLFVISFTAFVSLLPISIGALGVRENALAWSLAIFGIIPSVAIAVAMVNRVVLIIIAIFGGIIYTETQIKIKNVPEERIYIK